MENKKVLIDYGLLNGCLDYLHIMSEFPCDDEEDARYLEEFINTVQLALSDNVVE